MYEKRYYTDPLKYGMCLFLYTITLSNSNYGGRRELFLLLQIAFIIIIF